MTTSLVVVPGQDWARTVATELVQRLRAKPDLRICLPTGDTPTAVYEILADAKVSFARATVIALDEWLELPPDDPARCDGRLRRELIDKLAEPPTFHPIHVDDRPPAHAARAHDEVAAEGIDLAIVGLGPNGHVGFNEPGSGPDSGTRVVRLAPASREAATARYRAGRQPRAGITLGMDRLLAAGELWLLVTGARKAEVLARALEGEESRDCPATFLRRHPRFVVFADHPAAARLGTLG